MNCICSALTSDFPAGTADAQVSVADASDPTAWYRSFEEHWARAASIMQSNRAAITIDHVNAVFEHLDHVITALIYEVFSIQHIP